MKFDRKQHLKIIASKGGKARMKIYGNPGTKVGRSLGGKRSSETHLNMDLSRFVARKVSPPSFSNDLAEFVGILLGDGGLSNYQVTITLNKSDDHEYTDYVARLTKKLFNVPLTIRERKEKNVNVIVVSRALLVKFLQSIGLKVGNKVINQVTVPKWILADQDFKKKCAKGLLDTDGCFYVDKHLIKGKLYKNAGINFTNRSLPLLEFFKNTLIELGYSPTHTLKFSVVLRKEADIVRYFDEIGSSNPKHLNKFRAYIEEKGRVPKRS
jgi:hypothetical protein